MSQFSQSRPLRRAPRVNLRGTVCVSVQLENGRQLSAKLHQLSLTGGLLELSTYLEERSWIGLSIPLGFSVIHPTAEMMFPMWGGIGYLQPFRITRLRQEERETLDKEITQLLRQQHVGPSAPSHSPGARPYHFHLES